MQPFDVFDNQALLVETRMYSNDLLIFQRKKKQFSFNFRELSEK